LSKSLKIPKKSDYKIVIEEHSVRCVQGVLNRMIVRDYTLVDKAQ